MKYARTHAEKEPEHSGRNTLIILAVIVIIFAAGFFSMKYAANISKKQIESKTKVIYNNFEFLKQDDGSWSTQLAVGKQNYIMSFYHTPPETLNVSIENAALSKIASLKKIRNSTLYISLDPNDPSVIVIAAVEVGRVLGKSYDFYNLNVKTAFSLEINGTDGKYPIITCANATPKDLVMTLSIGNASRVYSDGSCIHLVGTSLNDTILVADALTYRLLDIVR